MAGGGLLAIATSWQRVGRGALLAGVFTFLFFGLSPVGHWLIAPLESRFPATRLDETMISDVVVLAGAERLRASAAARRLEVNDAAERVIEGAALAHRFPKARLWIIGGVRAPGHSTTDSAWTGNAWRRLGIAPGRILAVEGTLNTCENAAAVAKLAPESLPLLVTSAFHMPRAVACFRQVGVDPLIYPVDLWSWKTRTPAERLSTDIMGNIRRVDLALHEWIGLVWYRFSGRTSEFYPAPR